MVNGWKDISLVGKGWTFKKKLKVLQISPYTYNSENYEVTVYDEFGWTSETIILQEKFKSKTQALAYAKQYMRTH